MDEAEAFLIETLTWRRENGVGVDYGSGAAANQTGVKGEGRVRLPRAATATNARTDGVGSYTMADPQEFDLDKDDKLDEREQTALYRTYVYE